MNPFEEFAKRMVAHWEERLKKASEEGDVAAFLVAERELANYQLMLKTHSQKQLD